MKYNYHKKNRGFTLIELLVVVAIIGILAAVGVVAYSGYTSSAKNNVVKQNHKTIISVSSLDKELISAIKNAKNKIEKSIIVGECIADKMKKEKIDKIIFDRNGYKYHGRIKAVGDAIRNAEIQI